MKKYFFWICAGLALVISLMSSMGLLIYAAKKLPRTSKSHKLSPKEARDYFWNFQTKAIDKMVKELTARNNASIKQQMTTETLEKRLAAEKEELVRIKNDIETMRISLSERILEVQQSEQKNLRKLAATYSALDPSAAVKIFAQMEDGLVVKIMNYISPEPLGLILQAMVNVGKSDPQTAKRAVQISDYLRLISVNKIAPQQ